MRRSISTDAALWAIRHGAYVPWPNRVEHFSQMVELRKVLSRLEVECVLDVGANIGQFGSRLRAIGYRGWIVSFEPGTHEFSILRNKLDPKWFAHQIALANEEGERALNIDTHTVNNSFLPLHGARDNRSEMVRVRRLEGMLDHIISATGARRIFLKIDTQGFDMEVVRGAGGRIHDMVGLLSEISIRPIYDGVPHYLDSLQEYEALGFSLHSLHTVSRDPYGAVVEYDALMTR